MKKKLCPKQESKKDSIEIAFAKLVGAFVKKNLVQKKRKDHTARDSRTPDYARGRSGRGEKRTQAKKIKKQRTYPSSSTSGALKEKKKKVKRSQGRAPLPTRRSAFESQKRIGKESARGA